MNGINQEEVSNQSTLENYTLGYCWYPEQEYYSWCPSDLPKKTIHPDPGKSWFLGELDKNFIRNWEFVNCVLNKNIIPGVLQTYPKNKTSTFHTHVWFSLKNWEECFRFKFEISWNLCAHINNIHGVPQTFQKTPAHAD